MTINKKNKELIEELNKGAKPNETIEERRLRLKELVKERIKKDQEFRKFIASKSNDVFIKLIMNFIENSKKN